MTACGPLCGLLLGGAESLPLPTGMGQIWAAVPLSLEKDSPLPGVLRRTESIAGERTGVAEPPVRSQLPAVRAVTEDKRGRSKYTNFPLSGVAPAGKPLFTRKTRAFLPGFQEI